MRNKSFWDASGLVSHNTSMFITLWDVKDPTHLSQRVGRGVPGVLVWSLCYFMIHGMGGLGEVANGLMAAACGTYIC